MSVEEMALGLLQLRELSMYEIKKSLDRLASHYFSPSTGSLHPALQRLERKGLIVGRDAYSGNRRKKLFTPTAQGQAHFSQWLAEVPDLSKGDEPLVARLFFYGLLAPEERKRVVKLCVEQVDGMCRRMQALLHEVQGELQERKIPSHLMEVPEFQIATLEYGIANYQFIGKWLKRRFGV